MVRRISLVLVGLCLALLAFQLWNRKASSMIDPLKESGLSDEEIRRYRYLLALQDLSEYGEKVPASLSVDDIRAFLASHQASQCMLCDRWYLSSVQYCPADHVALHAVKPEKLDEQITKWEDFRKRYTETTRIRGLTRVVSVNLFHLLAHVDQR